MRIKIWAPSNLLSVVLDREISEAQAALVRATLEATDLVSEAELATLLDAVHESRAKMTIGEGPIAHNVLDQTHRVTLPAYGCNGMADCPVNARLEYLRSEIQGERISWGELAELADLAVHIKPGDVVLLEWAGVPEFPEEEAEAIVGPLAELIAEYNDAHHRCRECSEDRQDDGSCGCDDRRALPMPPECEHGANPACWTCWLAETAGGKREAERREAERRLATS